MFSSLHRTIDQRIYRHTHLRPMSNFPAKFFSIGFLLLSLVVVASGCGRSSNSSPIASPPSSDLSEVTPSPTEPQTSPTTPSSSNAVDASLISPSGIGTAQLGMTLGELKATLGETAEFTVESPFMVDFDAIAVRQNEEVQYYILYLAGETLADEDVIQGVFTDNPTFQTADGVGPGTPIGEAEAAYGEALLSYNTQNESREYVRFANQPARNISFATGDASAEPAGIYPSVTGEYNETTEFYDDATIQSVLVICLSEDCAPPASGS